MKQTARAHLLQRLAPCLFQGAQQEREHPAQVAQVARCYRQDGLAAPPMRMHFARCDLRKTCDHSEMSFFSLSWSTFTRRCVRPQHCAESLCRTPKHIAKAHPVRSNASTCRQHTLLQFMLLRNVLPARSSHISTRARHEQHPPACSISLATQRSGRHRRTDPEATKKPKVFFLARATFMLRQWLVK